MVYARTGFEAGAAAKIFHAHSGVACHIDCAHPRLRACNDMKGNIDQLLIRARREGLGNGRFVESVYSQSNPHQFNRPTQPDRGKTGARSKLAGALKLRIEGGALGSFHADHSDKRARLAAKDQGHTAGFERSLHLDGLIKSSGI